MTPPMKMTQMDMKERRDARHLALLSQYGSGPVPGLGGDGTPVVLHTDTDRGLTYTWSDQSLRPQDIVSRERGYLVSRLSVTHGDIEVAYLNVTSTTKEIMADTFATPFEWADENTGASFGFRYRDEVTPQHIWATAYENLKYEIPPASTTGRRTWGAYSDSEAPTDPRVLAAELATAAKVYTKQMRSMVRFLSTPFVDFSHVDSQFDADRIVGHPGNLRGTGIGKTMYVLAARHLAATRGQVLRASGCQSEEAQALWQRLAADKDLPVRRTRCTFWMPTKDQTQTYLCLDYTRAATVTTP